jgi:hypothetical protein
MEFIISNPIVWLVSFIVLFFVAITAQLYNMKKMQKQFEFSFWLLFGSFVSGFFAFLNLVLFVIATIAYFLKGNQ